MTNAEYKNAETNMATAIFNDVENDKIAKTLELLLNFFDKSKYHIFNEGKLLNLKIWNILRYWKFIKLAHQFIKDLVQIWK
jgi:hypothetical protein